MGALHSGVAVLLMGLHAVRPGVKARGSSSLLLLLLLLVGPGVDGSALSLEMVAGTEI